MSKMYLGVDIGGTAVKLGLVDENGQVVSRAERSVNLDVGETVQVDGWNSDGTAPIRYRGAAWTAIHRPGVEPHPGPHRVAELVGSRLLVDPL